MIHFSDNIDLLNRLLAEREEVFAICDKNVKHIAERLGRCANDKKIPVKYIQTSEKKKGMPLVMDICSWLLDKGADRGALVLAIAPMVFTSGRVPACASSLVAGYGKTRPSATGAAVIRLSPRPPTVVSSGCVPACG